MDIETVKAESRAALLELIEVSGVKPGQIVVIGCSTSEIIGSKIGTAGSEEVATALLEAVQGIANSTGIFFAIQCCEHLNRALVVERKVMEAYRLEQVAVFPAPHAGGSLAAQAMKSYQEPVVVETICAHAGLDIGATLIGMHLKHVAVPVRLQTKKIGQAVIIAARTRPKFIGGSRAIYQA
ncbi:TIGR01440 family protein [Anaerosinus massiliensis]|uniref:TIGR01440 family protein n=1 Tax=Massilibacillus massiliensis TaxID=1806837 RepID=UPI000AD4E1C9|nr:TIGR01440 family protein [Massilibacillus massiliensis]